MVLGLAYQRANNRPHVALEDGEFQIQERNEAGLHVPNPCSVPTCDDQFLPATPSPCYNKEPP